MSQPGPAELPLTFLGIAEGCVLDRPSRVQTLLGSCVAVTLYAPQLKAGGIFHALLPSREDYGDEADRHSPYRFVDSGVATLWNSLRELGVPAAALEAKVFGGANSVVQQGVGVGMKNVAAAFRILAERGVRVMASNVGGSRGRKLLFFPYTGEVFVKMLPSPADGDLPPGRKS